MSVAYYYQWIHSEVISMHGLEHDDLCDNDVDLDSDKECTEANYLSQCPKCLGSRCSYCLMTDW